MPVQVSAISYQYLKIGEEIIINITGKRNNAQRQLIRSEYKALFGRDILEDLEEELDGNFKKVVIGMYMSPVEYDVQEIYEAVSGAGKFLFFNYNLKEQMKTPSPK